MPLKTLRFSFWLLRKTYPWMHIVMRCWQAIASKNTQRRQKQFRLWLTVYKIDFSALLAFGSDLIQPEFWI